MTGLGEREAMALQSVGIVGGGAWGTALAVSARRAGRDVMLWAYEPETIAEINQQHRNALYLPGVALDSAIKATAKLNEVAACDLVLMVTPAQELRAIADELAPHMRTDQPLVIGAKGIEQSTGQLLDALGADHERLIGAHVRRKLIGDGAELLCRCHHQHEVAGGDFVELG